MAINQALERNKTRAAKKTGWTASETKPNVVVLGPKPFNGTSDRVYYEFDTISGKTEIYQISLDDSQTLLASVDGITGKKSVETSLSSFYDGNKAAHQLLFEDARVNTGAAARNFADGSLLTKVNESSNSPLKADTSGNKNGGQTPEDNNSNGNADQDPPTGGGPGPDVTKTGNQPSSNSANEGNNQTTKSSKSLTTKTQQGDKGSQLQSRSSKGEEGANLLYYPVKMKGDRIKIEIKTYQKSGLTSASQKFGFGSASLREAKLLQTIFLPIQRGAADTLSCSWGEGEMDPFTQQAANVAYSAISTTADAGMIAGFKALGKTGKEAIENLLSDEAGPEMRSLINSYFTRMAVGGGAGFLSRTAGASINNNLELLFQGPTLRSFSFTFRLTPREPDETEMIKKIIRSFKISMVPEATETNLFLLAPRVFDLTYMTEVKGSLQNHKYMNRFKRCALKDFSVNYTPDGQYMTYSDTGMTSYELSMTFAELDPVLANDYGDISATDEGMGF
jgi:hypothetical protein